MDPHLRRRPRIRGAALRICDDLRPLWGIRARSPVSLRRLNGTDTRSYGTDGRLGVSDQRLPGPQLRILRRVLRMGGKRRRLRGRRSCLISISGYLRVSYRGIRRSMICILGTRLRPRGADLR